MADKFVYIFGPSRHTIVLLLPSLVLGFLREYFASSDNKNMSSRYFVLFQYKKCALCCFPIMYGYIEGCKEYYLKAKWNRRGLGLGEGTFSRGALSDQTSSSPGGCQRHESPLFP